MRCQALFENEFAEEAADWINEVLRQHPTGLRCRVRR